MKPILADRFHHDGRGPTLQAVHLASRSAQLIACDFLNSDDRPEQLKHLLFARAQVFMFTPEEVENYATSQVNWGNTNGAAIVNLGRSSWLGTFNPHHLLKCEHYRVMFYDELLDVICEDIQVKAGGYGV